MRGGLEGVGGKQVFGQGGRASLRVLSEGESELTD